MPFFIYFFPKIFRKSHFIPPFYKIEPNKCQKWIPRKKICIPGVFKIVSTPTTAVMGLKNVFLTQCQKNENYEKRLEAKNEFK